MQTKQEEIISFLKYLEEKHMHLMDISGRYDRFVTGENNPSDFAEIAALINEWEKESCDN